MTDRPRAKENGGVPEGDHVSQPPPIAARNRSLGRAEGIGFLLRSNGADGNR